jgi:hypothetical protein
VGFSLIEIRQNDTFGTAVVFLGNQKTGLSASGKSRTWPIIRIKHASLQQPVDFYHDIWG